MEKEWSKDKPNRRKGVKGPHRSRRSPNLYPNSTEMRIIVKATPIGLECPAST